MKIIQPVSIWNNGANKNATILNLSCINDNLLNSATFYFQLLDATLLSIASGNLTMSLPDYTTDWTTNDAAYNWAATQLGLTITGEYVIPVQEIINNQIQSNEQSTSLTNS